MKIVGKGVREIRIYEGGEYRVIYTINPDPRAHRTARMCRDQDHAPFAHARMSHSAHGKYTRLRLPL